MIKIDYLGDYEYEVTFDDNKKVSHISLDEVIALLHMHEDEQNEQE